MSPTTGKKRAIEEIDVKDDDTSTTSCSTPTPTQQQPQPRKQRRPRKAPHELLSEAEKKANHIASEQKRRQNIRLGFEQLIEVVPALSQGNRSEALILQKCKSMNIVKVYKTNQCPHFKLWSIFEIWYQPRMISRIKFEVCRNNWVNQAMTMM